MSAKQLHWKDIRILLETGQWTPTNVIDPGTWSQWTKITEDDVVIDFGNPIKDPYLMLRNANDGLVRRLPFSTRPPS